MLNSGVTSSFYVKSFFAGSVAAAMQLARRELGADALLLNSREAPPEARHLGDYEVVFGTWPEVAPPPPVTAPTAAAAMPQWPIDDLRIDEFRHPVGGLRLAAEAPAAPPPPQPAAEQPGIGIAENLMGAGVETDLAQAIERGIRRRMSKSAVLDIANPRAAEGADFPSAAVAELQSCFEVRPEIGRITALVGPPGSGKTTTLVKLAITQCLQKGRAVRLLSADNLRIGGADQLRTYAAILGVPFQAVESTIALAQAVDSAPANEWLLIDTPGFSATMQQELGSALASFLRRRQDIDTQLVLTASMVYDDLRVITDRFAAFNPRKLIFTHLDETTSAAAIFSEAARTRRPVSFLSGGQSVPEDVAPATKALILESLVCQLPQYVRAAA